MKVIVGLGNPGRQYQGTRHNVGFDVIDLLAASPHAGRYQGRFQAQIAELMEGDLKLLLVKPETFMNLSGRSVRQVLDFYQTEPTELFVVCDDKNLPLGKLRARATGSHGGHNGLRDIQNHLGTVDYSRLKIGIGSPEEEEDTANYVLARFRPTERAAMEDAIRLSAQAVMVWAMRGIEACMNEFNADSGKKEKK